jgi:hypothetical protein
VARGTYDAGSDAAARFLWRATHESGRYEWSLGGRLAP